MPSEPSSSAVSSCQRKHHSYFHVSLDWTPDRAVRTFDVQVCPSISVVSVSIPALVDKHTFCLPDISSVIDVSESRPAERSARRRGPQPLGSVAGTYDPPKDVLVMSPISQTHATLSPVLSFTRLPRLSHDSACL